ncbi:MFS transporter [Paenibacillus piscarius]|uniref:MFS transporter n=1 Tax=Paenibacillus piscarius TaxID=1089681 RepID=UPI001EE89163|nr:MFS transporter [Paenibacillus piscarius]
MNTGQNSGQYSDQNWLRSFMFTLYGTSVLVVSYFPLFYAHLGFSSPQMGLLYSVGPLISILSNLFWSMMSDRLGTVRKIIALLLGGQLVTAIILYQATSFSGVLLILSVFYFFYYPVFPLADTMAIRIAQRHGRNFIAIRVFGSLGYSFFALTIGYVLRAMGPEYSIAICIVIVITALLITAGLKDVKRSEPSEAGNQDHAEASDADQPPLKGAGLRQILLQKEVLWFFGSVFLLAIGYRMNEAFLTISLKGMNAGDEIVGWALLASALSEIPVFFLLSKYGDRFKELPLLAFASLMFTLRFLFMALVQEPGMVVAIQAMHSISFGIYYVTAVRYITRMIPDHLRATGMAIFTVVWSSGAGLLSGTFGGLVYQDAGRAVFYVVATGFSILAFAGFLLRHLLDSGGGNARPLRKKSSTSL